jgi:DNA-binding CsgD family transcriptional regulator
MPGWYVQRLLLERETIRGGLFEVGSFISFDDEDRLDVGVTSNLESDLYSDLLTVEQKINELAVNNLLTIRETSIIKAVVTGESFTKLAEALDVSRVTISSEFKSICEKLAFYLGEHFTDEGYQDYLRDKYDLSEEEVLTLDLYMNNKFKGRHTK